MKNSEFKTCNLQLATFNSPSPYPSPQRGEGTGEGAGFTLIELIIVLFIIGISLSLTGIFTNYKGSLLELKKFARELSVTLRYARSHAVAEKTRYTFILSEDKRMYGLYAGFRDDVSIEEQNPIVYKAVPDTIETIMEDKDGGRIDFSPQGNSNGGMIEIRDRKGNSFLVIVNKITGRAEVRKIQNSK